MKTKNEIKILQNKSIEIRQKTLELAINSNGGHLTTAFSQTDILVALYYGKLLKYDPNNPKWELRDRLILSKGHGAIGLYPILSDVGFFDKSLLSNYCADGSIFHSHVEPSIPGVDFIAGSLGHGLPVSIGMALAAKLNNLDHKIFCILGDCELYEGSNWESLFFASEHHLDNLVCIIDRNKQGVCGYTDTLDKTAFDMPSLEPLNKKLESFNLQVFTINGHSYKEIGKAILTATNNKPKFIIAETIKGKGALTIENKRFWHGVIPKGENLIKVQKELLNGY